MPHVTLRRFEALLLLWAHAGHGGPPHLPSMSSVLTLDTSTYPSSEPDAPSASALPFIVRIAGLPATVLSSLGSPGLLAGVARHEQIQRKMTRVQQELVDLIESQLSRFSASERRFLLSVKRDCYNHRDLSRHIESSHWPLIEQLSPGFARRQLAMQEESSQAAKDLEDLFELELNRELDALYRLTTDSRFQRGLALSSPDVVQALREHRTRHGNRQARYAFQDRRQRKLDQTLLRFATRAAAKLSPNSTLTTLALGRIEAEAIEPLSMLEPTRLAETSCLRLDRIYIGQIQELLLYAPEIRDLCRVSINDTLEQTDSRRFRWVRPSRWHIEEEKRKLVLAPFSLVKAQIDTDLLSLIQQSLAAGADNYKDLSHLVRSQAGQQRPVQQRTALQTALDRFIEAGLLQLLPPWIIRAGSSEEEEILQLLQSKELADPVVKELQEALASLVELKKYFPSAAEPAHCLLEMRLRVEDLRELAGRLPPLTTSLSFSSLSRANRLFHESVFGLAHADSTEAEQAAALAIRKEVIDEISGIARQLYRFTEVFNHRHDFIHSLECFWRLNFPNESALPVLDLFQRVQPLWKQFTAFDRDWDNSPWSTFNPYDISELNNLAELRKRSSQSVHDYLVATENGYELPPESLESLNQDIPVRYCPQVGPTVLIQPLQDPKGYWVLNRLFEGTTRYSSRYISALPPKIGKAVAAQFADRAHVNLEGEAAEFLDLPCIRGGGVSEIHHPQTPWLLEVPGDTHDVPEDRKVRLSGLWAHFEGNRGRIRIRNDRGKQLLPVHMTSLNHRFLPSLIRFLSTFGPYEVRQVLPRSPREIQSPGCRFSERVSCGRLVISRRRWIVSTQEAMKDILTPSTPLCFYRAVQSWRERMSIPEEVYIYERIHSARENIYHHKPQYMNLASPLMTELFRTMTKRAHEQYILDEALPGRAQLTTLHANRSLEIQLELI